MINLEYIRLQALRARAGTRCYPSRNDKGLTIFLLKRLTEKVLTKQCQYFSKTFSVNL